MNNLLVFFKKYRIDILIIFIFLILPFIFFKNGLKLNSVILGSGDPTAYYFPLHQLKFELIKDLEMPFWNRYNFSGFPLLANPQANVFFPLTLILGLIFPVIISYNLSVILSYSLAGIFFYLFLKEYNLSKIACFTGGLIFMFSGSMVTHRSHATNIYGMVWVILILLFLEKYRKSRKFEYIFVGSIFYGISFFSSQPQIFLYSSLVILTYIIYYTFIFNGGKNYYFLLSGTIFLIGLLLISVQFFQTYELMNYSVLKKIDYGYFSSFSFSPKLLILLFFPFIYGNPFYQLQSVPTYFGPWNYTEMVIYFGIFTVPLLVFGFFIKNKHKYLWIFILIFSFFLVLGDHTPLYKLMYYVPLFNMFRVPARNWFEFGIAFSILAGFGLDYFIKIDKNKGKKILLVIIAFFSTILCGFIYCLLKTNLRDSFINFLGVPGDKIEYLLQSLKFTNYSVFIPIIIILCLISLLLLFLFKRNKFLYILFVVLIFLDLFSFGFFYEKDSDINYLLNKVENSEDLYFLNQENEIFRIYPVSPGVSGIILCNNKNIDKKIDAITGYDTLLLREYNYITGINNSSDYVTNLEEFLRNNNVLSTLNTKYIILPIVDNTDEFKDNITKSYWKDTEPVLDKVRYSEAEFKHSWLSTDKSEIIIGGGENTAKLYKITIDIEIDRDYMVSFEIRENKKLDNYIHFDFSGDNYDDPNQEFYLDPDDIGEEYMKVERVINSEGIPSGTNIYFRVFTDSVGEFSIKDLEIHEIVRYYDYETVYEDDSTMILENKNFMPRFYFVSEIIDIDSLEEARSILWEEDTLWDYDRFDVKTSALVQDIDFNGIKFNTENTHVDIIEYKNNEVTLETTSEDDSFLVFSDTYYPGWRAYIDNIETKVYRTNGIVKGIYVPEGKHTILFKYVPSHFWVVFVVSLSSFIFIIAGMVVLVIKRKRSL